MKDTTNYTPLNRLVAVLRAGATLAPNLAAVAAVVVLVASIVNVGPAWLQLDSAWQMAVALVALWGAGRLIAEFLGDIADVIQRVDGDQLNDAAELLAELRSDLDNGVDAEQVLMELKGSELLPLLAEVTEEIATHLPGEREGLVPVVTRLAEASEQLLATRTA